MPQMPSEATYLTYFDTLSNWGRWGEDDRLGTLNLITPTVRAQAAATVVDGTVISLSRDMDPAEPDPLERGTVLQRFMQTHEPEEIQASIGGDELPRLGAVREYVAMIPHGSSTHLDGLAHISWNGKNYNGFDASATTAMSGARHLSVHQASEGIISRGVLLDIPGARGVDWLQPGDSVFPEDLAAAEERQGVTVAEGDVLLLYTGNFKRIAVEGLHPELHHPGYNAACLPWLHERGVSLISSDTINDCNPCGFETPDLVIPVHAVALVAMGLWMVDNMNLDELAETCAQRDRYEFMFAMLPWRMVGVTSSPVNPVAIF